MKELNKLKQKCGMIVCRDKGRDKVPLLEDEEGERQPGQGTVGKPYKASYHG